jgi:phosphoglycerate dehydrogenase-like enzyme
MARRIAVAPTTRPLMADAFRTAVLDAGAELGELAGAEGLIWADPARADLFPEVIARAPRVRWIQLPYAGIEPFLPHLEDRFVWTCGKGVYAPPVAEHVLALTLAGLRHVPGYARATSWEAPVGRNLLGARVTIFGGGGICEWVLRLFEPFGCRFTVVRRRDEPVAGACVLPPDRALEAVRDADVVVLALALTPATRGLVDREFLAAMAPHAWLVNVGRGAHVVTDDLVEALRAGTIGGAALDVTDPEPLPAGHPLWTLSNCIVTPHIANTPEMGLPLIAARVRENAGRFARGDALDTLEGLVDVAAGY